MTVTLILFEITSSAHCHDRIIMLGIDGYARAR